MTVPSVVIEELVDDVEALQDETVDKEGRIRTAVSATTAPRKCGTDVVEVSEAADDSAERSSCANTKSEPSAPSLEVSVTLSFRVGFELIVPKQISVVKRYVHVRYLSTICGRCHALFCFFCCFLKSTSCHCFVSTDGVESEG
jgi:hypothetical protein